MDNTPTGKLICQIMFAFAEFERDMTIERTQEDRAKARKHPDYYGEQSKKYTKKQLAHELELIADHSYSQVKELTGISKATLVNILA